MLKLSLIFLGAGVGGVLRYLVSGLAQRLGGGAFPVGTLTVNILGCLVIGFLGSALAGPVLIRDEYRTALLVGLIGAFTTYSTFADETFKLVADRQLALAGLNLLLSTALGLAAVWIGIRLAQRIYGV